LASVAVGEHPARNRRRSNPKPSATEISTAKKAAIYGDSDLTKPERFPCQLRTAGHFQRACPGSPKGGNGSGKEILFAASILPGTAFCAFDRFIRHRKGLDQPLMVGLTLQVGGGLPVKYRFLHEISESGPRMTPRFIPLPGSLVAKFCYPQ
jgi:hypothetical protein